MNLYLKISIHNRPVRAIYENGDHKKITYDHYRDDVANISINQNTHAITLHSDNSTIQSDIWRSPSGVRRKSVQCIE